MSEDFELINLKMLRAQEVKGSFPVRGAIATFLFKVMPVDGQTHPKEMERLTRILVDDFSLTTDEAHYLIDHARKQENSAETLREMANILKQEVEREELLTLISHMWEMVFADERMHETEIVFVERVASLLDVKPEEVAEAMNH